MSIQPGIYKHYKGNLYRVIAVAKHSENLEDFVFYETLYENEMGRYWLRPLAEFCEQVTIDGNQVPRFIFISN